MKKLTLLCTLLAIFFLNFNGWASMPSTSLTTAPNSGFIRKTNPNNQDSFRVAQMKSFISMTADDYGKLRGKKLNFLERISFKASQRRMKHLLKYYDYGDGPTTLQKIAALLKGLLLGPIALLLGYLFLKDDQRELIKWIWFGFAGFAAIVVIILLAA